MSRFTIGTNIFSWFNLLRDPYEKGETYDFVPKGCDTMLKGRVDLSVRASLSLENIFMTKSHFCNKNLFYGRVLC